MKQDTIVCYPNRKMYSRLTKTYVMHRNLRDFLRAGIELKFIDSKTQGDITRSKLITMYHFLSREDMKGKSSEELINMVKATSGAGRSWRVERLERLSAAKELSSGQTV